MKRSIIFVIIIAVLASILIMYNLGVKLPSANTENHTSNRSVASFVSPYIQEYSLYNNTWPNAILVDKNGIVWIIGSNSDMIKFDPNLGKIISSYSIERNNTNQVTLMSWTMVEDQDGFIWFSQLGKNIILRFDPSTDKFASFGPVSAAPFQMKVEKETGNIWFTTLSGNTVGVIQKDSNDTNYKITEFNLGNNTNTSGLYLENRHVWVTQIAGNKITEFNIARDKNGQVVNISELKQISNNLSVPTDVLVSSNAIWITEHGTTTITKYQPDSQDMTRFPTSENQYHISTLPLWLKESLDKSGIWFNEHGGNRVGYLDTKNMTLTEYEIPSKPSDGYVVYPLGISLDPYNNNKMWFSEWNTDKIATLNRGIPAPFDIHSDIKNIEFEDGNFDGNQTIVINLEVDKTSSPVLENNIIHLNSTSSIEQKPGFGDINMKFVSDTIDLSKQSILVQLVLKNYLAPPGNYTLTLSATDGIVTKSIFIDLLIKK